MHTPCAFTIYMAIVELVMEVVIIANVSGNKFAVNGLVFKGNGMKDDK